MHELASYPVKSVSVDVTNPPDSVRSPKITLYPAVLQNERRMVGSARIATEAIHILRRNLDHDRHSGGPAIACNRSRTGNRLMAKIMKVMLVYVLPRLGLKLQDKLLFDRRLCNPGLIKR